MEPAILNSEARVYYPPEPNFPTFHRLAESRDDISTDRCFYSAVILGSIENICYTSRP